MFIAVIVKNLSYSTKEKIYSTIGIEKESSSTSTTSFNGISSSEDCDYDEAIDYFNREDPSQVDPKLTSMLKVCSLKNVSLHLDGKILTCKNDGVSTTIDGSYKSVIIGGTQWFTRDAIYGDPMIIASSCRAL